jgi:dUTP pyrophosphatase
MKKRKVKIILKDGFLPEYTTLRSSGADVRSNENFTLEVGHRKMIHTGIFMQLPDDMEVQVRPRSGLAIKFGVTCINAPGTIDSDYQGECNILLINHGERPVQFSKGERIAQFVFVENVVQAEFEISEDFSETTERGAGGFGHSGTM